MWASEKEKCFLWEEKQRKVDRWKFSEFTIDIVILKIDICDRKSENKSSGGKSDRKSHFWFFTRRPVFAFIVTYNFARFAIFKFTLVI